MVFQRLTSRQHRGFTLIEILVAVAIFGMLSIAAYTVLDAGMRSKADTEPRLQRLAEMQRLMHKITEDINYLSMRRARNELGDIQAILSGSSDLGGQTFELSLTRTAWRNPARFPRSNLQHVSYRLEEQKLYRKHWIFPDQAPNSPEQDVLLAEGIISARVQFQNNQQQWLDQWGIFIEQQDQLPRAMRIRIETKRFGVIERFYYLEPMTIIKEDES